MTKAIAILLICLASVIFALSLQAAPSQAGDNYLPFITGGNTGPLSLALQTITDDLERPVDIANAGDERLFVVERAGRIRIVEPDGTVLVVPFLDIRDRVEWMSNGEQGLLGLAFDPNYAANGYFYVNYTAKPGGDTRISRFQVSGNPDLALADSEEIVLTVDQPAGNHNGGDLAFGPEDGYLYIALGDGGGSNDPWNNAQALDELLGKILRIDVDSAPGSSPPDCGDGPYRVPTTNPFHDGQGGACDEVWALGLRNPWRFSFDAQTQAIYIADVGQSAWEEVNVQPAAGGTNYGWSCYEGAHPNPNTSMPECLPATAYTMPAFEYNHDGGECSVTGGFVYRGEDYPALVGHYLFTDYCSGIFWEMRPDGAVTRQEHLQKSGYSSFGEGVDGELYVANVITGELFRVAGTTGAARP